MDSISIYEISLVRRSKMFDRVYIDMTADKAQLRSTESLLGGMAPMPETGIATSQCKSADGSMRYLESNSTATIDDKVYDVSTIECTYSSDLSTAIVVSKTYRHESPERIYLLQLEIYRDLFADGQNLQNLKNTIDIMKYSPIIDNAVHTLRVAVMVCLIVSGVSRYR